MIENLFESKEYVSNYIEWQKHFVKGNQFTEFNIFDGSIQNIQRRNFFDSQKVFNLIKKDVDEWDIKYGEIIWGQNKYVDQLIPYQIQYNNYMNQVITMTEQLAKPILVVEDGAVDIDALEEEGLAPGKLLVYRQGSIPPTSLIKPDIKGIELIKNLADSIKNELKELIESIEIYLIQLKKKS